MEEEILQTIKYFSFFTYAPTSQEIHAFLKKKASKRQMTGILKKMVKEGVVTINPKSQILNPKQIKNFKFQISNSDSLDRYTLPEYSKQFRIQNLKFRISQKKIAKIERYINLLVHFPQIKLVGLSGTVAMMNASNDDDIDLFIITAKKRLFTGRFVAVALAELLNLRRRRITDCGLRIKAKDKVCLNLFFDEKDLKIPKFKRTEYVAHEILQMKPLVVKGDVYQRFLKENKWVFGIFPNAKSKIQSSNIKSNPKFKTQKFGFKILNFVWHLDFVIWTFNLGEKLLKRLQLYSINHHKTSEIITDSQLWFHPEDFGKKIYG